MARVDIPGGASPEIGSRSWDTDQTNAAFYNLFPYPWRTQALDRLLDPRLAAQLLNQAVGSWSHQRVPSNASIWVAGCGANQAVITALTFPDATVLGSDLSPASLQIERTMATQLGLGNLELRRESINEVDYRESFDYVICTGVIHHNAKPTDALRRVARSLRRDAVLELMVYNQYNRIGVTALQKAIAALFGNGAGDAQARLDVARAVIAERDLAGGSAAVRALQELTDIGLADALLQPLEYSYTISSFAELVSECELELLVSCPNQYDRMRGRLGWNFAFENADLRARYERMPDGERWAVANYLWRERSPSLWFYCGRPDATTPRVSEAEICAEFLDRQFRPSGGRCERYVLTGGEEYQRLATDLPFGGRPDREQDRKVLDAIVQGNTTRNVLETLGMPTDFIAVNELRLRLTTPGCPYLVSA